MGSLIITGAPGAGKSTLARSIAESEARSVHLDSDGFWFMIISGYVSPWLREAQTQNVVVIEAVACAAVTFDKGGYEVVIDGIIGPWFLDRFASVYRDAGLPLDYVVLRASQDVLLSRVARRTGQPSIPEQRVAQMHASFERLGALEPHCIDNDGGTPDETITRITALRRAGSLRVGATL